MYFKRAFRYRLDGESAPLQCSFCEIVSVLCAVLHLLEVTRGSPVSRPQRDHLMQGWPPGEGPPAVLPQGVMQLGAVPLAGPGGQADALGGAPGAGTGTGRRKEVRKKKA